MSKRTYGNASDHERKAREWFGPKGEILHSWYDTGYLTGFYVVRTPSEVGIKIYFVRTMYIGELIPENVEISIDKTEVL